MCVSAAFTPCGSIDADVRRGARAEPGGGGAVKRDARRWCCEEREMSTDGSVFLDRFAIQSLFASGSRLDEPFRYVLL